VKTSKYPIQNLVRLYIGMAVTSFLLVFAYLFLLLSPGHYTTILIFSLLSLVSLLIKGVINLGAIFVFEKYVDSTISYSKKLRYGLTIFFNICLDVYFFAVLASLSDRLINLSFLITVGFIIFLVNIIVNVIQDYVILYHFKARDELEYSLLKTARAEAVNELLKQQIHPHFLFNSLNTIKSLYKIDSKAAEEYIVRLSDFLRASISKNNHEMIPLKDEIKLCIDYLEIQKIRFGSALQYSISISETQMQKGHVPAFSIQLLLENAIKHNGHTKEVPLNISIQAVEDRIRVTNNLQYKVSTEPSLGTGLANLAERYRIISNDELIVENDNHTFSVSLKILGNGDSNNRR